MNNRLTGMAVALCGGLTAFAAPFPALAQSMSGPTISLEAETDHRERGLGWSDGKAAISAGVTLPVIQDLNVDLEATTLRGSRRHGGADVGLTLAPSYTLRTSGWDFTAGVRGHAFIERSGLAYWDMTGSAAHSLGPAQLVLSATFAPSQGAIGGSNLYVDAQLGADVPGTPITVYGGLGHSSGSTRNERAARLRPGGDYLDHYLGAEYNQSKMAFGLRYSGTSIGSNEIDRASLYADRHFGSRLVAYLRFMP